MKAIGGYFELADYEEGVFLHKDGVLLNLGRNALEYILRAIGDIAKIYLPYYTCEVVLEPLKKLQIPWTFYHINTDFEIADEINVKKGEYVIANNYYGIKDSYIIELANKFGEHLIVDCAQALFAKPIEGIKCFYSTRKFVGVADGGVAYLGNIPDCHVQIDEKENTTDHNNHLLKRKQLGAEAGFPDYQKNEKKFDNQPIRWMSDVTKEILEHIDYEKVVVKRRDNYKFLHDALAKTNNIVLPVLDSFICPMVYPFFIGNDSGLRKKLIENKVFVAKYWPNIQPRDSFDTEYYLANGIIPIPCDQRYGERDMERIIMIINKYNNGF